MMVQNAAFIPDAFPTAPAGTAAPAAPSGAGGFQQVLQGKQAQASSQGKAEAKQPAEAKSARETGAKAEEATQPERRETVTGSRNNQPGEASQGATRKGAVSREGGPTAARQRPEQDVSEDAAAQEEVPATAGARDEAPSQKVAAAGQTATPAQDTTSADLVRSAQESVPAGSMPDPNPGLVVAAAQLASHQEQNGVGNAEAGAQALSRLEALQQRLQQPAAEVPAPTAGEPQGSQEVKQEVKQEAKAELRQGATPEAQPAAKPEAKPELKQEVKPELKQEAKPELKQEAKPELKQEAKPEFNPEAKPALKQEVRQENTGDPRPSGAAAGVEPGQKAQAAQLSRDERGAQVLTPTGATERAQVEKPQAPRAQEAVENAAQPKVLPEEAKTSVVADQAAQAERLSARQQGEGRFVAMPVRSLFEGTQTAQAAAPAAADDASTQQTAPAQGNVATPTVTTAGTGDAATREAAANQAPVQVQVASGEVKQEAVADGEAQATQASDQADSTVGKVQQHREMRHTEAATAGKEGRGAEQALQAGQAKSSGEEISGTGRATTAAANPTPEAGTVREASEGHGADTQQKGEQQKGEQQNGHMAGAGVVAQGNTAEAVPGEAKQAPARTPLHESILAQVKEGVVTHDGKGNGQMSIRLNPGELGELKIQVRMENNRLHVEVQADNRMVKDLLLGNLDSLKEALSGKNLTMDGFNVSTGGGGFNGPLNEERGNPRQQQPQRFARSAGYDGQEAPRVNYLTAEVNSLLDVRF